MRDNLLDALRVAALAVASVFVTAQLAACEGDDFAIGATVLGVEEVEAGKQPEELTLRDEDLRIPEVGWRIELRLDDGGNVSLERSGGRRLQPGERVRVLKSDDGELLL